jgi:hypothetical protein
LSTTASDGLPWEYSLEGDVEDVSRQHIANRAAATVHPANWYVGIRRLPYFAEQKNGVKTEIVAAGLDGTAIAGVPVEVKLTQIQWESVRRAEGGGFYTWETEKKEIAIGSWTVTTGEQPVPFETTLPSEATSSWWLPRAGKPGTSPRPGHPSSLWATATPRGRVSITTASIWCPSARHGSPERAPGS